LCIESITQNFPGTGVSLMWPDDSLRDLVAVG
jgi:hypothetical protein